MGETVTKNEELAEIFDSFFITMVNNLKTEYDIDTNKCFNPPRSCFTGDRNI